MLIENIYARICCVSFSVSVISTVISINEFSFGYFWIVITILRLALKVKILLIIGRNSIKYLAYL